MTTRQQERIASLCSEFRLPTVAAEVVPRFQAAEHAAALATLLEVLELEAGDRRQRRDGLAQPHPDESGEVWMILGDRRRASRRDVSARRRNLLN